MSRVLNISRPGSNSNNTYQSLKCGSLNCSSPNCPLISLPQPPEDDESKGLTIQRKIGLFMGVMVALALVAGIAISGYYIASGEGSLACNFYNKIPCRMIY